jgi:hypothetical protein
MDQFRTELILKSAEHKISLYQPIITLGSCFADNIGQKLSVTKFSVSANPFGTIYNPVSIHKLILQSVYNQLPLEHTYLSNQDISLNYDFHSEFAAPSKSLLEPKIKDTLGHTHHFLRKSKFLFITYGTSLVYERLDTGEVVANCHKQSSQQFKKNLLSQKKILESFDETYKVLKNFNPEIRIILTVSPVRHIKDTLELNSVSKSILRLTCHTLTELYNDVEYFPAYEILLDDLRDYRFYSSDLIHPTPDAIDYIWKKFSAKYFDLETKIFLDEWQEIAKALSHKPFQPNTQAHQKFLNDTLKRLQELKSKVNVSKETKIIEAQLMPKS